MAVCKAVLSLGNRQVLKALKYSFDPATQSYSYFTVKFRYEYMYTTLRDLTPVKNDFINQADKYKATYEKDW